MVVFALLDFKEIFSWHEKNIVARMTDCFLMQYKSSHRRCSERKGIFRNFAKFIWKHLHQSLVFNKVAGLRLATLLKKRLWHRCFTVNFCEISKNAFFTEHLRATVSANRYDERFSKAFCTRSLLKVLLVPKTLRSF